VSEHIEQRRVKLSDLICCGGYEGYFARLTGETLADRRKRFLAQERAHDRVSGKVAAYERAMARGVEFPPVFVFAWDGEMLLDDGWHRCAAAALLERRSISAVVFNVTNNAEADALSELLFDLEAEGLGWQERTRLAVAWLKVREHVVA
jgi:hypothetical protein